MKKEDTVKDEIILQAQKLFMQFGVKKTTMDEIAEACGKAKSTLYHYFKNKEEVFDAVLLKEVSNLRKTVSEKVTKEIGIKNKMKVYFLTFHAEAISKLNLLRVLKQEIKKEISKSDRFNDVIKFEADYVANLLKNAYKLGDFTDVDENDIPWFAEIAVVAFLGIVRYSIEKDGELDQESFVKVAEVVIPKIF